MYIHRYLHVKNMQAESDLRLRKRDVIMPIKEEPMLTYTRTHAGQKRVRFLCFFFFLSFLFFFSYIYWSFSFTVAAVADVAVVVVETSKK